MINTKDQEQLFRLIAEYLKADITCIAIGGTAMMLSGYKNTTKDIDLVFMREEDRKVFIEAITRLGYQQKAIGNTYDLKRKQHIGKPFMFSRGEERFDLFVGNVFGYALDFNQDTIIQRNDFLGKHELSIHLLPVEELILLKAITRREKDHEDIETILAVEKNINWTNIIDKAISQRRNNHWMLIDLEESMQELRKKFFIKQEHFERIYKAQED